MRLDHKWCHRKLNFRTVTQYIHYSRRRRLSQQDQKLLKLLHTQNISPLKTFCFFYFFFDDKNLWLMMTLTNFFIAYWAISILLIIFFMQIFLLPYRSSSSYFTLTLNDIFLSIFISEWIMWNVRGLKFKCLSFRFQIAHENVVYITWKYKEIFFFHGCHDSQHVT